MNATELLFNPFKRYAGVVSLLAGLTVILLTAFVAVAGQIHLDGVLDLHISSHLTLLQAIAEGVINFACMGLTLYLASLLVSSSKSRLVDIFGTQALARMPYLPAVLVNLLPDEERVIKYMEYKYMNSGDPVELGVLEILVFAVAALITLLCLVWMILLMYNAYAVSANVSRARGIVSFIVALITAEILSKLLIHNFII